MIKIKILSVGKTKESWLEEAMQEYIKRLTPYAEIECLWLKDSRELLAQAQKEKNLLCLDPNGEELTSEAFAQTVEKAGSRFTLVIGDADGLPEALKKSTRLISLSRLTFTHQMTRVILLEQIFRAFEIKRGSPYHK
jgi:23S rRNA (pseudouridine1915-N3)-methyltransferase